MYQENLTSFSPASCRSCGGWHFFKECAGGGMVDAIVGISQEYKSVKTDQHKNSLGRELDYRAGSSPAPRSNMNPYTASFMGAVQAKSFGRDYPSEAFAGIAYPAPIGREYEVQKEASGD